MRAAFDELPAYGGLSAAVKDNHYWFGSGGYLFTSPWVATRDTMRHAAVILLSAGGTLTEIAHASGFVDSSHLCRGWQASYGPSPSCARDASRIRIVA